MGSGCGSVGRAEWSVPTPPVLGLTPVIGTFYTEHVFTVNCGKDKNKEKSGREIYTLFVSTYFFSIAFLVR